MKKFLSFPQGFLVLIFVATEILILMTYPHIFFPTSHTTFIDHLIYLIGSRRNIIEKLNQAMSASSDIKAVKDPILKKNLNDG